MTPDPVDRELRALFHELRDEDRQWAPTFQESMAEARRESQVQAPADQRTQRTARKSRGSWARRSILSVPGSPLSLLWKGGILAAAAVAAILLIRSPGVSDAEFERVVRSFTADPASGAWESPTDDLLKLPGLDLLSSVPSLGERGWPTMPGTPRRRNQL